MPQQHGEHVQRLGRPRRRGTGDSLRRIHGWEPPRLRGFAIAVAVGKSIPNRLAGGIFEVQVLIRTVPFALLGSSLSDTSGSVMVYRMR